MTVSIPDYITFDGHHDPRDAAAVKACWARKLISINPAKHVPPSAQTVYKRYVFNEAQKARAKERAAIWRAKQKAKDAKASA